MAILTKNYRLIWSGIELLHDPYMEFSNSQTMVNTSSCFESDDIQEIEDKINELGLVYNNDEEEENNIDFEEIIE